MADEIQRVAGILAGEFGSQINGAKKQATEQFSAVVTVLVAGLRLRIKKQEISADEAIQEIEQVRKDFPEVFGSAEVSTWTQWAIDCLRGETPLHGSVLDQATQRAKRKKGGASVASRKPQRRHGPPSGPISA